MTHSARMPDLEEKTRFLLDAASYPQPTRTVRLVETHMARVFLTDDYAYKMKKPVRMRYLDFSTLDRRYRVCSEELRLNRRLTDGVYLDLVPLWLTPGRRLSLRGPGTPVEWLVQMRRLPESTSLPQLIHSLSTSDLQPLLNRLRDFYRAAPVIPLAGAEYLARLQRQCVQLHDDLLTVADGVPGAPVRTVAERLLQFMRQRGAELAARADAGLIVEGHGDLRPEHCFLTDPPQIIDCLEFNASLRWVDPLDELGYLALECELLGREDLGGAIVSSYCGAAVQPSLIRFYKANRALLRAQLAAAHLQDGNIADPDKWRAKARRYLAAALRYSD